MTDEQASLPVGEVETALREDIAALGLLTGGFRRTLAELSYVLAHRLDLVDGEDGATAVSLAKALLATLGTLVRGDGGSDDDAFKAVAARMSSPVGDSAQP